MQKEEQSLRRVAFEAILDAPIDIAFKPLDIQHAIKISRPELLVVANGMKCIDAIHAVLTGNIISITRKHDPNPDVCTLCVRRPKDGADKRKLVCNRAKLQN